jgi:hypothetical protein
MSVLTETVVDWQACPPAVAHQEDRRSVKAEGEGGQVVDLVEADTGTQ